MFEWVGFDEYDTWAYAEGYASPSSTCASTGSTGAMCALIGTLRSWVGDRQRMIAVPWGSPLHSFASSPPIPSAIQYWMMDTNTNMWQ